MTMTHDEIKKLAHLARIEISDAEIEAFAKDFDSILAYVAQINETDISDVQPAYLETNIARVDEHPYQPGSYVEKLLADAPSVQDGFYKVPKIL